MCWSLSVAKGEATSETKVSEKERRFSAPAGEAASSSPQPQGSRGLAPGTRTDARLTTHPGSGQSLPARRTTTVTSAPTTPPMPPLPLRAAGSLPGKQLRLHAARHRLLRPRLVPHLAFSPPHRCPRVTVGPGLVEQRALRPFQLFPRNACGSERGRCQASPREPVLCFQNFP